MPIYGDMLAFFPELEQPYENFSMVAKLVSGYDKRVHIKYLSGIFQKVKVSKLQVEGDTLNQTEIPTLWTRDILEQGTFIKQYDDTVTTIYRVTKDRSFEEESDMNVYELESVVGTTDTQTNNTDVNITSGW